MKLHRHYKNKPYKVHGIAKHSESLEDLVVYETLYENPTAKLWVRPRVMFEGEVDLDGRKVLRFEKMALRIEAWNQLSEDRLPTLSALIKNILGEWDPNWFQSNIANHTRLYFQIGYVDKIPVGFKIGYELDQWTFYSWLGGVLLEYRGVGIASDLMTAQHAWCREQGYRTVQTRTQNRWRSQLILNIKVGFDIIGYHASNEGGPKIMMEKVL